jgi:hypothetical protein
MRSENHASTNSQKSFSRRTRLLGPILSNALRLWVTILGEADISGVPERDDGTEGPPTDDNDGSSCSSPALSNLAFSRANRRWGANGEQVICTTH